MKWYEDIGDRLKVSHGLAYHHLISRVVQKRRLMDGEAMEAMRQIYALAGGFCGDGGADVLLHEQSLSHLRALDPKETEDLDDAGSGGALPGPLRFEKKMRSLGFDADDLEVILKEQQSIRRGHPPPPKGADGGDVSVFMREV